MRRTMALLGILGLVIGRGTAAMAETAPSLDGHWEGVILVRPGEFEVDVKLDLVPSPGGTLTGHLSYPNQGTKTYVLDTVARDGDGVLITSTDEQGVVSIFQGKLVEEGKIVRGELTEGGRKAPFELHRADPTNRGAPVVHALSRTGDELKAEFNADALQVRLIMVLSPTCSFCRMGARLVERHLLEASKEPGLSVFVVWEQINGQDSEATAAEAASLLSDPRIRQFWSPDRFASSAFKSSVGMQRGTAFDVYLVFGRGKTWQDVPPAIDLFMHNQKQSPELPVDRLLNAVKLNREVQQILAAAIPAVSK